MRSLSLVMSFSLTHASADFQTSSFTFSLSLSIRPCAAVSPASSPASCESPRSPTASAMSPLRSPVPASAGGVPVPSVSEPWSG